MDIIDLLLLAGDWLRIYTPQVLPSNRRKFIIESHLTHEVIPIHSSAFPGETLATLCISCDEQLGPEVWSARADRELKQLGDPAYDPGSVMVSVLPLRTVTSDEAAVRHVYGKTIDSLLAENQRLDFRVEELQGQLDELLKSSERLTNAVQADREGKRCYQGWTIERAEGQGAGNIGVFLIRGSRRIFVEMPWTAYLDEEARWAELCGWIDDLDRSQRIADYLEPDALPTWDSPPPLIRRP